MEIVGPGRGHVLAGNNMEFEGDVPYEREPSAGRVLEHLIPYAAL